jgi:hypothetical protein
VAAKHGVLGLIKTVALEGAEFGVTANAICPGYVETPLVSGQIADTAKARNMSEEEVINEVILKAQPTKQFVQVGQIAALAQLPRLRPGSADHRRSAADGRWMDRTMSVRKPAVRAKSAPAAGTKTDDMRRINLALQGGGAHGAFTWGVVDRLLDEPDIEFEGLSGTSAGAVNAVVLAHGLMEGGRIGGQAALEDFWRRCSEPRRIVLVACKPAAAKA